MTVGLDLLGDADDRAVNAGVRRDDVDVLGVSGVQVEQLTRQLGVALECGVRELGDRVRPVQDDVAQREP